MIHTTVTFHVLPGKTEEFEARHRHLLEVMSAQTGCVEMSVDRSLANPLEYLVLGTWTDKQSWERAHQNNDQFKSLFSSLPIERHTLSLASFFEPAYAFAGAASGERSTR